MSATKLFAYMFLGAVGIIIYHLGRSEPKPATECYLWLIGTGWLIGAALAFYAWQAA